MEVFADEFEEFYVIAVIMDPFQKPILASCILILPVKLKIKFMKMTECLIGFTENYLELLKRSKIKVN